MSTNTDPFISHYNEDVFKYNQIGRPVRGHEVQSHPDSRKSFAARVWDCRDFIFQEDVYPLELLKWGFKGAFIASAFTCGLVIPLKTIPQLTLRKMSKYIDENNFGRAKVFSEMIRPSAMVGAALGMSYYSFFYFIWKQQPGQSLLTYRTLGGAFFGALVVMSLYHPKLWWAGLYGGGAAGLFVHSLVNMNQANTRGTPGSVIPVANLLTDEQRKRQANKDYIHTLSLQLPIKYDTLQEL